jgi:hypothetical protein
MALAVQSAFEGSCSLSGSVRFPAANAAGNGLIVVAYFSCTMTNPPALTVGDSQGNIYLPLMTCGVYSSSNDSRNILAAWYVPACKGGENTVTVQETVQIGAGDQALAVGVLEYAGGFTAVDVATGGVTATQTTISLTFKVSGAGELVLLAGGTGSMNAVSNAVTLDASTTGYTLEGMGQAETPPAPYVWGAVGAWDQISSGGGLRTAESDFSTQPPGNCMLAAALILASAPSPPPPPPSPPSPSPPSSSGLPPLSSGVWPTIF